MPEVGEEAVARGDLPESTGPGGFPVVLQSQSQSSVAWDAEEVFQELDFEHR